MFIFSMAACQKENIKDVTENPPVLVPDTILQYYAGTFSIDSSQLEVDTAYCFVIQGFDSTGNPINAGYVFSTGIDVLGSPLDLFWLPLTNTEIKIQPSTYQGVSASAVSPITIDVLNNWILQGENPNNLPFGGDIPTESYEAMNVNITVSNLVYSIFEEDLGGGVKLIIDRGTVELDGNMVDSQGSLVPISGKFVCFFESYGM